MRNLNFELKQLCQRNRDGSFATQRDRGRVLDLVAGQLQELGDRYPGYRRLICGCQSRKGSGCQLGFAASLRL